MGEVAAVGTIRFKGRDIAGLPSYRIARLGLGYVPENRDIFPEPHRAAEPAARTEACRREGRWRLDDMLAMFPN